MTKPHVFRATASDAVITARSAKREIAHLEKIVHFARSTDIKITSEPY